jgi:hypothetical protein
MQICILCRYRKCNWNANAAVRRYAYVMANGGYFKHLLLMFSIQIQINEVTQKLTNLIRVSARFQITSEVDRDVVSQMKLHK